MVIDVECEEVDKIRYPCTQPRKKAKPNAFWKLSSMLKPPLKDVFAPPLALLNNEERRAIEAHQLEVEQKRSVAIMHARSITCR